MFFKKIHIGTSGWIYSDWEGVFYPEDIPSSQKLKYYAQRFNTVEVNYSFYHLPRPSTYQKWFQETPSDFIFSVKVSRYITHIKRLKEIEKPWQVFIQNASELKEKLGPLLLQFPPSFKAEKENIKRLENFLKIAVKSEKRLAMEFRHLSWSRSEIYNLLKKYQVGWVIADSSRYPKTEKATTDFVYIRMHGPGALFASKYSQKDLEKLTQLIKKYYHQNKEVFVYFNNDFSGYALENALLLRDLCTKLV